MTVITTDIFTGIWSVVKSLWLSVTAALTVSNLTGYLSSAICLSLPRNCDYMSRGHEVQVRQQLVRLNDLKVLATVVETCG